MMMMMMMTAADVTQSLPLKPNTTDTIKYLIHHHHAIWDQCLIQEVFQLLFFSIIKINLLMYHAQTQDALRNYFQEMTIGGGVFEGSNCSSQYKNLHGTRVSFRPKILANGVKKHQNVHT